MIVLAPDEEVATFLDDEREVLTTSDGNGFLGKF
jgi:hypothetical protein